MLILKYYLNRNIFSKRCKNRDRTRNSPRYFSVVCCPRPPGAGSYGGHRQMESSVKHNVAGRIWNIVKTAHIYYLQVWPFCFKDMIIKLFTMLSMLWDTFITLLENSRRSTNPQKINWMSSRDSVALSKTTKLILLDSLLQEVCIKSAWHLLAFEFAQAECLSCQSQFFIQD